MRNLLWCLCKGFLRFYRSKTKRLKRIISSLLHFIHFEISNIFEFIKFHILALHSLNLLSFVPFLFNRQLKTFSLIFCFIIFLQGRRRAEMTKQRPARSLIFCAFGLFLSFVCSKFVGEQLSQFILINLKISFGFFSFIRGSVTTV